ncbi:lysozyme [Escherichia coli TW10246]|nr:lysozyme [Escherichia coli TW10246]
MNAKIRYGLSAAVLALIGAGASAPEILDQFLDEKKVTTPRHTVMVRVSGPSAAVPSWWMVNLSFRA